MNDIDTPEIESTETDETITPETEPREGNETPPVDESDADTGESAGDMFTREYVEGLRQENAKYRQRAQRADELAHRLHTALVRSDGRLHDPSDLAFEDAHLADDGQALTDAITDLIDRKPHLAARKPAGDIGQGAESGKTDVNLLGILRGN